MNNASDNLLPKDMQVRIKARACRDTAEHFERVAQSAPDEAERRDLLRLAHSWRARAASPKFLGALDEVA